MAYYAISSGSFVVHPTKNDVASTIGDGKLVRESVLTDLFDAMMKHANWICQGFDYNADSGLDLTLNSGEAFIDGYYVNFVGTKTFTLAPSATNYIYLRFSYDVDDDVTAIGFEVNTTGTPPSTEHVPVMEAVTDGSTVLSWEDKRILYPPYMQWGTRSTSAPGASDDIDAGFLVGSRWIKTDSDTLYECVDNTAGAAVWITLGPSTASYRYVPSVSGAPGGTPTTYAGWTPMAVDTTNSRVYFYISGTWRYATLT